MFTVFETSQVQHDTARGQEQRQQELPLLGTTFAVKDNLMVRSNF